MADLSKFSIGGTAYNLKDSSARDTANAVTTAEEYDRQHNTNSYAGRSLASVFANEIGSTDVYMASEPRSKRQLRRSSHRRLHRRSHHGGR